MSSFATEELLLGLPKIPCKTESNVFNVEMAQLSNLPSTVIPLHPLIFTDLRFKNDFLQIKQVVEALVKRIGEFDHALERLLRHQINTSFMDPCSEISGTVLVIPLHTFLVFDETCKTQLQKLQSIVNRIAFTIAESSSEGNRVKQMRSTKIPKAPRHCKITSGPWDDVPVKKLETSSLFDDIFGSQSIQGVPYADARMPKQPYSSDDSEEDSPFWNDFDGHQEEFMPADFLRDIPDNPFDGLLERTRDRFDDVDVLDDVKQEEMDAEMPYVPPHEHSFMLDSEPLKSICGKSGGRGQNRRKKRRNRTIVVDPKKFRILSCDEMNSLRGKKPKVQESWQLYCAHCRLAFNAKPTPKNSRYVCNHACCGANRRQFVIGTRSRNCKHNHKGNCIERIVLL